MGVPWSFQVWRGHAGAEALADAFSADILSLAQVSARLARRDWPSTGQYRRPQRQGIRRIHVLFSESEAAMRALGTASRLASELNTEMTILITDERETARSKLRDKVMTALASEAKLAGVIQLSETGLGPLLEATLPHRASVLITESGNLLLQQVGPDQCLDALACPILLVR